MVESALITYSIDSYKSELRAAVRGLYQGVLDIDGFWQSMQGTIRRGLTRAWERGAGEFGVALNELTQAEQVALQSAILYEYQWIQGYAEVIIESRNESRPTLPPSKIYSRLQPWIGRYEGVRSKARAMAAGDEKLKWVRGATSDACRSCMALSGKVKRAFWWISMGILPRTHGVEYLTCKGFN